MALRLPPAVRDAIRDEAAGAYPHECCGFLLGAAAGDAKSVTEAIPAPNRREDSLGDRYLISPRDYLDAERRAASRGEEIVGFYHSHPDHPADPSEFDREHALPWCSYIIVSVRHGRPVDLKSWVLASDRARFEAETVTGVDPRVVSEENPSWPS